MYEVRKETLFQKAPRFLERLYQFAEHQFLRMEPLFAKIGYDRVEKLMLPAENLSKNIMFDCQHCGQCVLHYTGMTCPMTCPKQLRNGPCGGVRLNGNCEVVPEMRCVWVRAWENSRRMPLYGNDITMIQPMHDWEHEHTSAWVNLLREDNKEIERPGAEPVENDLEAPAGGSGGGSVAALLGLLGGAFATFMLSAIAFGLRKL